MPSRQPPWSSSTACYSAPNGFQGTRKLHQEAVAGGLHDPAMMGAYPRLEKVALESLEARQCAFSLRSIIEEKPTTSAARIAARRRVVILGRLPSSSVNAPLLSLRAGRAQ